MRYEIDININEDVENVASQDSAVGSGGAVGGKSKNWKALGKYVAGQTITPIISNAKTMVSQQIGIVTGNREMQERINFGMQMLEVGSTLYSTAQAGVVVASAVGLGAGVGLGLGALVGIAGIGISIGFNQQQINLDKRMENYQLQQVRDRKGIAYNKSRS